MITLEYKCKECGAPVEHPIVTDENFDINFLNVMGFACIKCNTVTKVKVIPKED